MIDTATNTVEPTVILVGKCPDAVAVTPDGKHVYVANADSANVSVIDTTTNTVVAYDLGGGFVPHWGRRHPGWETRLCRELSQRRRREYLCDRHGYQHRGAHGHHGGECPQWVAVTPDGKHVYVANTISANVSVIDTTNEPPP